MSDEDKELVESLTGLLLSDDYNDVELGVGIWINSEIDVKDSVLKGVLKDINKWYIEKDVMNEGNILLIRKFGNKIPNRYIDLYPEYTTEKYEKYITSPVLDQLVEILNSDNVDDFKFARDIVYEQFIMTDDEKSLYLLVQRLKRGGKWGYSEKGRHKDSVCRVLEGTRYFYNDYEVMYANKGFDRLV